MLRRGGNYSRWFWCYAWGLGDISSWHGIGNDRVLLVFIYRPPDGPKQSFLYQLQHHSHLWIFWIHPALYMVYTQMGRYFRSCVWYWSIQATSWLDAVSIKWPFCSSYRIVSIIRINDKQRKIIISFFMENVIVKNANVDKLNK